MRCEWTTKKLSEIANFSTGKLNSNAAVDNGKYPFFTCAPEPLKIDTYSFDEKAIILAGNNAEGNFHISFYEGKFNAYQRTYIITSKHENVVDTKYLYYALKLCLAEFKVISQGTTTKFLTARILSNFEIILPAIYIQNKIAAILSALDEKIATNGAINDNLQQQARTLYKSWFVDFEPFDKRMPDLWKIGKLKDVLCLRKEVLKAGKRTDLCYLPIDTIPMNTFALTATRPNEEAQSSLLAFYCDDIIIGAMRVYFHRVIIAPFDGITRSTCFVLTPKDPNYLAFGLLCCDQDKSIDFAQQSSKGSTMPYAVWDGGLGELEIAIPPQDIASEFNRIIMPMIREIQKSYYETEILNNIRDTLLPKLMSGEIDVSAVSGTT